MRTLWLFSHVEASGGKQHVDRRNEKMVSATRFCGATPDIHYDRLSSKHLPSWIPLPGLLATVLKSSLFQKFFISLFLVVNFFFLVYFQFGWCGEYKLWFGWTNIIALCWACADNIFLIWGKPHFQLHVLDTPIISLDIYCTYQILQPEHVTYNHIWIPSEPDFNSLSVYRKRVHSWGDDWLFHLFLTWTMINKSPIVSHTIYSSIVYSL